MPGRPRWIWSGCLLLVAGALTALSTWRHWADCRSGVTSEACVVLQEKTYGLPAWGPVGHRDTLGTALVAVAAVLLGTAWLTTSGWARRNAARTLVASIIGLQPLVVAVLVTLELLVPGRSIAVLTGGWLTWVAEMLVFPLLLGAGWILEEAPLPLLRLMLLGWGATSFGPLHHFGDFVSSALLMPRTGATPPGLGYVTAGTQACLGLGVVAITLLLNSRKPEEGDERRGPDGFTLAA